MKGIWLDGAEQSGPWVQRVWDKALSQTQFSIYNFQFTNCLILGLGAGVAAGLVAKKFPGAKIMGVEIDPEMVVVGKKSFGLQKIDNLEIVVGDAFKVVPKIRTKFDLILVDLYVGKEFPKEAASGKFLRELSQRVSDSGVVVFNRLTMKKGDFDLGEFLDKLGRFFAISKTAKVDYNILIFCSRK